MFTRRIASFLISWSGKSYKATEKLNNDNSSRLWRVPVSPVVFKVDCEEFLSGNGFLKQENNLCFVVCSGLLSHQEPLWRENFKSYAEKIFQRMVSLLEFAEISIFRRDSIEWIHFRPSTSDNLATTGFEVICTKFSSD